ncbi:hypothetical protein, partial [Pseudomonas aeruginosa]|uniref:hypothetical protein n=1 Tax=Pseudomonas aeruginosa TaxID=287 RepID=UPI0022B62392
LPAYSASAKVICFIIEKLGDWCPGILPNQEVFFRISLDSQKMLDTIKSVNDSTVQAIKQAGIDSAAAMREATEAMSHPQAPVTFNIHGATDPHEVAREVNRTLDERQRREEAAAGQGF